MKCPACQNDAPAEAWQCPACGDHLGQWQEMDSLALQLRQAGFLAAEQGNGIRAVLCLAQATVLKPDEPVALRGLGELLAHEGEYDDAKYYLGRSAAISEFDYPAEHDAAKKALSALQSPATPPVHSFFLRLGEVPLAVQHSSRAENTHPPLLRSDLWAAVTDMERCGTDAMAALSPVLELVNPAEVDHVAPFAYLRGLAALARGNQKAAWESFRRSVAADMSRCHAVVYLLYLRAAPTEAREELEFLLDLGRGIDDILNAVRQTTDILQARNEVEKLTALTQACADVFIAGGQALSAESHGLLGRLLCDLGQVDKGRACLQKALELDPVCPGVEEVLARFTTGVASGPAADSAPSVS